MRGAFTGLLLCAALLGAGAPHAATLTRLSSTGLSIQDGTSNSIQFGADTRATVCIQGGVGSIGDGTSNTILFGAIGGFSLTGSTPTLFGPVGQVADGTSNTILLGESANFCLQGGRLRNIVAGAGDGSSNTIVIGETAGLDICFSNVSQSITDGTSNTILIGTNFCTLNLRADPGVEFVTAVNAAVPAPPALLLLGGALALLYGRGRRAT